MRILKVMTCATFGRSMRCATEATIRLRILKVARVERGEIGGIATEATIRLRIRKVARVERGEIGGIATEATIRLRILKVMGANAART